MAAAIVTVVYSIVIGKGLNVLDAPIAGVVPHPVQHFDVLGHKSGLGSVDISPPPDERRNNTQYTHVVASEFFKTRENPAVVLYFIKETFDQMALLVGSG
jgi:hypothetical protein